MELLVRIEQFTAYFYSGQLDTLSILEQHGYFKNCLDPAFTARIANQLTPTMPVFDMEGSKEISLQGKAAASRDVASTSLRWNSCD